MKIEEIIKAFKSFNSKYDLWTVFQDFLSIASISISQPTLKIMEEDALWEKREKEFLSITMKYSKDEVKLFTEILAKLFMCLTNKSEDVLGQVFTKLNLNNKWKGQFFTPQHISDAMAKMIMLDCDKEIKSKGYLTVCDPCCGGGSLIIGAYNALIEKGYKVEEIMYAECQDIDIRACQMTYIQLSLLGIPACVKLGNSLTGEVKEAYFTPMFFINKWYDKLDNETEQKLKVKDVNL